MPKKRPTPDIITYRCVVCWRRLVTRDKEPDKHRRCTCGEKMKPVNAEDTVQRVKNDNPTPERASVALTRKQSTDLRKYASERNLSQSAVIVNALRAMGVIK